MLGYNYTMAHFKTFFVLISTEHNISSAQKLKCRIIKIFHALKLSDVVYILQKNVKMPTIVGVFNIFEQDKFHAQGHT